MLVPRHPQRGDAVAGVLAAAGLAAARRSRGEVPTASIAVYLADTLGELGLFYRLAPVAFIGNSLVDGGGHNPLEAVQLGAAVLYGPHVKNFADVFARLDLASPTARVTDAASLAVRGRGPPGRSRRRPPARRGAARGLWRPRRRARRHHGGARPLSRGAGRMRFTAPPFWWRAATPAPPLSLWPFAKLWAMGAAARLARPPRFRPPVAVVCVGNYVVGGAGKTPTVIALAGHRACRRPEARHPRPRLRRHGRRGR